MDKKINKNKNCNYCNNVNLSLYNKLTINNLEIPKFYIGYKKKEIKDYNGNNITQYVEQYGKINYKITYNEKKDMYLMDYGHFNFHEALLPIEQIRELTDEEIKYHEDGNFWKLPQNFYQSV